MSFSESRPDIRFGGYRGRFSAGELLRCLRRHARMSQVALATSTGVGQSHISEYESGTTEPSFERLTTLVAATGHRLVAVPTTTPTPAPTIYEMAARIATILAEDTGAAGHASALDELWVYSVDLCTEEPAIQVALCVTAPGPTGAAHFDAALAAVVEHRLGEHGAPVPGWVHEPGRYLSGTWIADPSANLDPGGQLMPFLRHGIMVTPGFFDAIGSRTPTVS